MSLDSLKNTSAPKALARIAAKHNRLVALIESIEGKNGIEITVSEGNILISINPDAFNPGSIPVSNELHYADASTTIDIDRLGIVVVDLASLNSVILDHTGLVSIYNGDEDTSLTIDPTDITHNMSIREIDVCIDGDPKKMLIIGSAPYDP